jgi:energy-converting hydrogenase Eha subunit A
MVTLKQTSLIYLATSALSIITLSYLGIAYHLKNKPKDIPFEYFPVIIPIFYGITGIIIYQLKRKYNIPSYILGAIVGLLLSLIGRFILQLPTKLFNFTKDNEYQVHIYAIILYGFIFQFISTPFTKYILNRN